MYIASNMLLHYTSIRVEFSGGNSLKKSEKKNYYGSLKHSKSKTIAFLHSTVVFSVGKQII